MQTIKKKLYIFAAFTFFCVANTLFILTSGIVTAKISFQILLIGAIALSIGMAGLWLREYNKLKIALLIVENHILHIYTAVITDSSEVEGKSKNVKYIEVFVSYFGILLDSRIIKFNQDGIWLKDVEIGCDFISLTYGTDKRVQNMRLLRGAIDPVELEKIVERFQFETGIVPVIVD